MDKLIELRLTTAGAKIWNLYWSKKYKNEIPKFNPVSEDHVTVVRESTLARILGPNLKGLAHLAWPWPTSP